MSDREERAPAFLRHGAATVLVFVVAVSGLVATSDLALEGPPLVAFTVGFVIFVTAYFGSMWAGWLFFE